MILTTNQILFLHHPQTQTFTKLKVKLAAYLRDQTLHINVSWRVSGNTW